MRVPGSAFVELGHRLAVVAALVIVVAGGLQLVCGPRPIASAATECRKAHGPFHDDGTKVLQADGSPFLSYGVTVTGLAHQDYQGHVNDDVQQIDATAQSWCSNTVRLQVAQDNLVGETGSTYSKQFMDAINTEVIQAERDGLVVVINAKTDDVEGEPAPTDATVAFWHSLMGMYRGNPQVVFDVFNEPRLYMGSVDATWKAWQQGGTRDGRTYLGMQDVVDSIRHDGANNLVWIEGPGAASTLKHVRGYPITGGPLSYAIHHPRGNHDPSVWDADFGFLVRDGVAPVMAGEWAQYASSKSECWKDAPTAVPTFLKYLEAHSIGLNVWELAQGVLLESADLADPMDIGSNYHCVDGLNQGAGRQIMDWYKRQNAGA
jgi:cellulase (glycosyl hydrolase family 5)